MLMTLAGREMGEFAAQAKGEAYMTALEDIPYWAVEQAIRNWYRGDCGDKYDYKWAPDPATLRELSKFEAWRAIGLLQRLTNLLVAKPIRALPPLSEEHCAEMKSKLESIPQLRAMQ